MNNYNTNKNKQCFNCFIFQRIRGQDGDGDVQHGSMPGEAVNGVPEGAVPAAHQCQPPGFPTRLRQKSTKKYYTFLHPFQLS